MPAYRERRRRFRANVHWAVRLLRHPERPPIDCVTVNLSSEGFFCLCDELFVPGELLQCIISVPAQARAPEAECMTLRCLVQVVRVESSSGRYGVGCHIENYRLIPPGALTAD